MHYEHGSNSSIYFSKILSVTYWD